MVHPWAEFSNISDTSPWYGEVWNVFTIDRTLVRVNCYDRPCEGHVLRTVEFAKMVFGREISCKNALAFAMGTHARLGQFSCTLSLPDETLLLILDAARSSPVLSPINPSYTSHSPIPVILSSNLHREESSLRPIVDSIHINRSKHTTLFRQQVLSKIHCALRENNLVNSSLELGSCHPDRISLWSLMGCVRQQIFSTLADEEAVINSVVQMHYPEFVKGLRQAPCTRLDHVCLIQEYSEACRQGDAVFHLELVSIWALE